MTSRTIPLLFATETGTTEMVADEVVDSHADNAHFRFVAKRMDAFSTGTFSPGGIYLLMTSSTGRGELPRSARAFWSAFEAAKPTLAGVRYGLIGFGDRHYAATFGGAPRIIDKLMQDAGAQRVGELAQHDRQSGTYPETFAMDFLASWLPQLQ